MKNITKNKEGGFIQLIIIIIIALLLMRYFNLTITGILNYFQISWNDIGNWFNQAINWFKDLVVSVK